MKISSGFIAAIATAATLALSGCASEGLFNAGPTTAALPEKPKLDPACVTLASQIDALRKEGVAERVEEAAKGKSATVTVKRASLGKMAELNKANAEYQARCGTVAPGSTAATAPAQQPAADAAKATKAVSQAPAATAVKAKAAAPATAPAKTE